MVYAKYSSHKTNSSLKSILHKRNCREKRGYSQNNVGITPTKKPPLRRFIL